MKTRTEFVAMVAAQLVLNGKSPDQAAADAEALGLNLEKRNIAFWEPEGERIVLHETFAAGVPTDVCKVFAWAGNRWQSHPLSSMVLLPPGFYKITISALDKTPAKP